MLYSPLTFLRGIYEIQADERRMITRAGCVSNPETSVDVINDMQAGLPMENMYKSLDISMKCCVYYLHDLTFIS
jgi:hypothetical protein